VRVTRIRRTSATDEVFKALHGLILSGELKPGDRLPSQRELAERLDVSRSTLREAIHKLVALGMVTPKQGVGTTVVEDADPLRYMRSLEDHFLLDGVSARDFLEARMVIETAVARLAVQRAEEEQRSFLEDLLRRQERAAAQGDMEEFSRLDTEFHLTLARASGNRVLLRLEETILDLLRQFIRKVSDLPGAVEDALQFHRKITQTLHSRDLDEAGRLMAYHLADVAKRIKDHLGVNVELESVFQGIRGEKDGRKKGGGK
jgi:GntR family transcriptional repressor for pyruvate dehydrogenase complex